MKERANQQNEHHHIKCFAEERSRADSRIMVEEEEDDDDDEDRDKEGEKLDEEDEDACSTLLCQQRKESEKVGQNQWAGQGLVPKSDSASSNSNRRTCEWMQHDCCHVSRHGRTEWR